MCGILGIADKRGTDEAELRTMRDTMFHRGPDDAGLWLNNERTVGLAHRRLSIIDLSEAGRQPMSDREGNVWLTFNGEIYNFREIRNELRAKGYIFGSNTDTEVLLNAYKEWGSDCLNRLNGMFSFGIYDEKEKLIFLARDRIGKKPLYYSKNVGRFCFSSELKALLADRSISREIDLKALNDFLAFGYVSGDSCIFSSVRKLPPASAMIYDLFKGEANIWRYWNPPDNIHTGGISESDLLEELESLIKDAVRLRLSSDVPLGAFLSGGVDSSLIVALMCAVSGNPVKTFSIGFDDSRFDELSYARIVANHFHTDHHEMTVKADSLEILPALVNQFDEPFADSSMIPTYYVSRATKDFVTVALSGDGGDELFGGYSSYLGTLVNHKAERVMPYSLRKAIGSVAAFLPERKRLKRHLSRLKLDPLSAFIDRAGYTYFTEPLRKQLFRNEILSSLGDSVSAPEMARRFLFDSRDGDLVNRMTYTDFMTYLPDDVLVKVDRASMLVSLEVRAPLLDYRLAEFSFRNIPGGLKVKNITTKYLLKKLAEKILPPDLDINRKWGFSIPVSEWFRGNCHRQMREFLLEGDHAFFRKEYIAKLINEHMAGVDHGNRLFTLLSFTFWKRKYLGG
jgi:asparagine synthase (glutamine-hydrolysing)